MKKIISLAVIASFIIGGISLGHSAKANIIITDYYSVVYVNVDNQPVDRHYVLRITNILDGDKSRDIRPCSEGSCGTVYSHLSGQADKVEYYLEKFPEEVPGSTSTKYYKNNKSSIEASYQLENINFIAEESKQYDYQVDIDSSAETVEIKKINEGVYKPHEPEFKIENVWFVVKSLFVAFWYVPVVVIFLCVGAIWLYRFLRKKKK